MNQHFNLGADRSLANIAVELFNSVNSMLLAFAKYTLIHIM